MNWRTVLRLRHLNNLGLTAAELVVTVAIIAALAAVSIPMMKHYAPTYNTKLAVRDIVSQMQLARIHAIKNRVRTVVVFSPTSFTPAGKAGSFMIFEDDNRNGIPQEDTDNNWVLDSGERVIMQTTDMRPQVSLVSAVFTANLSGEANETFCYGFDSQGLAASVKDGAAFVIGEVQLQNSRNQTRKIAFQATGKAKITKGS
jgi:type IV fimbrial biogenesis protein FimT